jgi:hypothetical protein
LIVLILKGDIYGGTGPKNGVKSTNKAICIFTDGLLFSLGGPAVLKPLGMSMKKLCIFRRVPETKAVLLFRVIQKSVYVINVFKLCFYCRYINNH